VFESHDGGANWTRLSRVGGTDEQGEATDLIVDSIVVDASDHHTLFAGVWRVDRPDGGLYVSHDSGKSWKIVPALQGQSVLALAQAPSNPDVLAVGSLQGVIGNRSSQAGSDLRRHLASPVEDQR
jgi:photosystem II stability/assembly factor-like uncharacterized protein